MLGINLDLCILRMQKDTFFCLYLEQALPTQSKKIMQFLQFIPRCGENAFDCFLEILGKRSLWLANKLQEKHREKMEQMLQSKSDYLTLSALQTITKYSHLIRTCSGCPSFLIFYCDP